MDIYFVFHWVVSCFVFPWMVSKSLLYLCCLDRCMSNVRPISCLAFCTRQ